MADFAKDTRTVKMNNWRIALAQKIAPIYANLPDIAAVALLGGVARGLSVTSFEPISCGGIIQR